MKITSNGTKTEIDFQGANLPDGRPIEEILNENEKLKTDLSKLKIDLQESSSILTKWIPSRKIRIIVEIILIFATIVGFIQLLFLLF